jgi:hypothetical protein
MCYRHLPGYTRIDQENFSPASLPAELRDANPRDMTRPVDGATHGAMKAKTAAPWIRR